MPKSLLITSFFLVFILKSYSQTEDNPWSVSLGTSIIDVYPTGLNETSPFGTQGDLFESFFNVSDHWNIGGPSLSASRFLAYGFSLGIKFSFNTINKVEGSPTANYAYYNADGFLKWSPLNTTIKPFLSGGYGYSSIDIQPNTSEFFLSKNVAKTLFGGLGILYSVSDQVDFSAQFTYRSTGELYGTDHFEHLISVHYNFGLSDADGDGIPDKKDDCPDVPGLKEFNGCPDTDEDGIMDKEDDCPEVPGLEKFKGCPDTDADGVRDPDDVCPEIPGDPALQGCLDSDKDGLIDPEDECPNEAGAKENNGCPWDDTDGDGVPDNEDQCKDQAGTASNNGCPEISNEVLDQLNKIGPNINFIVDSAALIGKKTFSTLDEITLILKANPEGLLNIEGYASSDGSEEYNHDLSLKRAESVRNYLIRQGIPEERMIASGFGENEPIADNDTERGRAVNRRVQFKAKL